MLRFESSSRRLGRITIPSRLIGAYGEAIEWQPEFAEAFCNRSCAFLENAEYDRALEDCDRAIRLKPGLAQTLCNRGTVYVETGNLERAVQEYERAISLEPDFALAFSNLGFALFLDGKFDLAAMIATKRSRSIRTSAWLSLTAA